MLGFSFPMSTVPSRFPLRAGPALPGAALCLLAATGLFAQPPHRPHITGVAHISILAHDFEKSRAFYGQFLGFQEPYSLKNADGSPSMIFFKVNERQYIEIAPERQAGTDRLSHISFETDDIELLRQYLASRGVKVPDAPSRARIGNLGFNIVDPAGHTIEFVQYTPQGWSEREKGKYLPASRVSSHMPHVGIIVTQFDPEYKFYTEILGFQETWRGSKSGDLLSWVNLRVPDGTDYVELMLYKDEPAPTARGSAHHLCLVVPDIAASVAALKAEPYFKTYGRDIEIRTGINRKRQANLFDPDGTRTELMEPKTVDGTPTPSSTAPPPQ
jgi:catechol 2,3-dioxygenase-like lactoylglutathione lyase family enzyme